MTDLTQDWKDGKLKEGSYYIKLNTGEVVIDYYKWNEDFDEYSRYIFDYHDDDDIATVIKKVPDYNLWQNLYNTADMEHKANNILLKDVERLKKDTAKKIKQLEREANRLSEDLYVIANNGNPDFDAKKYAQKAWDAISTKYLKG